ncbi:MAG: glycosyltransferase N-terminal domain-containing protein, partial [Desulfobacterales bacterium]|nr:glycosyltransferase N-terminal domain-containing protein [Desulfobacterales bacterium]
MASPLIAAYMLASGKRRKTAGHRLGLVKLPEFPGGRSRPGKKPVWVHALSVGEVFSAEPLIHGLKERFKDLPVIFSVSTHTGHRVATKILQDCVDGIFFFPYDLPFSVKRISGKINPALIVIVETDIWPNFLFEMRQRHIPVVLVNGRLSTKSFLRYQRALFFMKTCFAGFVHICAQSPLDVQRF